jgi:citrate lyase subunit beta/citryl-CoA lyase
MVLASRLAGIRAPVDGVSTAIDDAEALRADAERARRLGSRQALHPSEAGCRRRARVRARSRARLGKTRARRVRACERRRRRGRRRMVTPVMLRARAILDDEDD